MLLPKKPVVRIGWRTIAAVLLFFCAFFALIAGVSLSERPTVVDDNLFTKAYYSLGLFVMGGLDLGMPQGGPVVARYCLWFAYLGAPFVAASALIEAMFKALAPKHWQLRKIKNHIIIVGTGDLTMSYLKVLRSHHRRVPIVVIDNEIDSVRSDELKELYNVMTINGDITHDYFLLQLRIDKAVKILMMGNDNFQSYEAAHKIIQLAPQMANKVVIHCDNLRFMRAMAGSRVAALCHSFNSYHLAAAGLVKSHLIEHFHRTEPLDMVIIAGFGRFGQTIMEEVHKHALNEIESVAIIDLDAHRRVMVTDEQIDFDGEYERLIFEGNISNPTVWKQLRTKIDLTQCAPVIILGTGAEEENLRTAIWLRDKYPDAMIIARTNQDSKFAQEVGREYDITSFSMTDLIESNIPDNWVDIKPKNKN
ncbi:MAG: NAD-binding protein [Psychrosphaera sp.]|nr:NAD-binding protein [Psychrosphaera sp.]